jgi:hypothetical protein
MNVIPTPAWNNSPATFAPTGLPAVEIGRDDVRLWAERVKYFAGSHAQN